MEGYIGGIALPTNVTLRKCIPSMLCVVDVYLTIFMKHTYKSSQIFSGIKHATRTEWQKIFIKNSLAKNSTGCGVGWRGEG